MSGATRASSSVSDQPERDVLVGRCYTKARRHPLVIGRFPGGGRLWGGPYTIPQLVVLVGSFVVLILFQPVWAHFGWVLNIVIAVGVPFALSFAVRRVSVDGRNPLAVAGSVLGVLAGPAQGRLGGRPLKAFARPTPVRSRCTLALRPSPTPAAGQQAAAADHRPQLSRRSVEAVGALGPNARPPAAPAPVRAPAGPVRVRSGAQALLAARADTSNE
ncbi:hypothetical protein [Streptomyces sp. NPDC087300]|uniref:hypothetical protein n=1 Tax=Streptomyces sp. NPDC087300 TaxID=3365780 RepID=UPI00382FFF9B